MVHVNLYFANLDSELISSSMGSRELSGLERYRTYLEQVEKYRIKNSLNEQISFQILEKTKKGVLIQLTNIQNSILREIQENLLREVYEYDPDKYDLDDYKIHKKIFSDEHKIKIEPLDDETLLLARMPTTKKLIRSPNIGDIIKQHQAIISIQKKPTNENEKLLHLFDDQRYVKWPSVNKSSIDNWFVLKDTRDGVDLQREFVRKALATDDFAFLEGPPGSGKTTVLCEIIRQLIVQGKRVLMCASTHVAVDNLLEKLIDKDTNKPVEGLVPLRIGRDGKISDRIMPWQYDEFLKTQKEQLEKQLSNINSKKLSQSMMLNAIQQDAKNVLGTMIRDCANLVCGTTIGILGHPDIKNGKISKLFDVLIIDEASKTTFQEFLVPALCAKKWIIVGDTRQLPPFVEESEIASNFDSCISDAQLRDICLDVFFAKYDKKNVVSLIVTDDKLKNEYKKQCKKLDVKLYDVDDSRNHKGLHYAKILVGTSKSILSNMDKLPLDIKVIRNPNDKLDKLSRRINAHKSCRDYKETAWGNELCWRIIQNYQDRVPDQYDKQNNGKNSMSGASFIKTRSHNTIQNSKLQEIEDLLPSEEFDDIDYIRTGLDDVKMVALPSVLESLQYGFKTITEQVENTAITNGLPKDAFKARHVLLKHQYRMHPDIAEPSHKYVYNKNALFTPDTVKSDREWSYNRYASRCICIDIRNDQEKNKYLKNSILRKLILNDKEINIAEAEQIIKEIKEFYKYAADNQSHGHILEIAILTFYREQERVIRRYLRKYTNGAGSRYFEIPKNNPILSIELCTVDRFQGHEADLVFLSMVKKRPTSFINNLNRLNVAFTRARFQFVLLGDRKDMHYPPLSKMVEGMKTNVVWR